MHAMVLYYIVLCYVMSYRARVHSILFFFFFRYLLAWLLSCVDVCTCACMQDTSRAILLLTNTNTTTIGQNREYGV